MRIVFAYLLTVVAAFGQFTIGDPALNWSTLQRGVVGYWRMEESSGTRYDRTSYGNHLTANNSPSATTGHIGNGLSLVSASSQYLSIASNPSLTFTNNTSLTVALWLKAATLPAAPNVVQLVTKASGSAPYEWELYYSGTYTNFAFFVYTNATSATFPTLSTNLWPPATSTWYFVAAGYDTATHQSWIQGSTLGGTLGTRYAQTWSNQILASTGEFQIGAEGGAAPFNGVIDEVGVWKRILSTSEVGQILSNSIATWPKFQ